MIGINKTIQCHSIVWVLHFTITGNFVLPNMASYWYTCVSHWLECTSHLLLHLCNAHTSHTLMSSVSYWESYCSTFYWSTYVSLLLSLCFFTSSLSSSLDTISKTTQQRLHLLHGVSPVSLYCIVSCSTGLVILAYNYAGLNTVCTYNYIHCYVHERIYQLLSLS